MEWLVCNVVVQRHVCDAVLVSRMYEFECRLMVEIGGYQDSTVDISER
jgi:hypothetical protein